ncbi:MAG: iron-containing alcohol dehydrogenase [Microgenomates group bacterium]
MRTECLPTIQWVNLQQYADSRPSALITSSHGEKRIKPYLTGINIIDKLHIETAKTDEVDAFLSHPTTAEIMYGAGGGVVTDITRLAASEWKKEYISIPTAITSDAFLVNSAGIREHGCVRYIPAKKASLVLFDNTVLQEAPKRLNVSGCGDVLSIATAVYDWKLANTHGVAQPDEKFNPSIALMANNILNDLLIQEQEIKHMTDKGLQAIIHALSQEVQLCYFYGNSRPEEGGEHFLTYNLEAKIPHAIHGELVSLGILTTLFVQKQPWKEMKSFMDTVGLSYKPNGLTTQIMLETLESMQNYVTKHNLRYSVYNEFSYTKEEAHLKNFLTQDLHII